MRDTEFIKEYINGKKELFIRANDAIHDLAELSYEENGSMEVLISLLKEEGFEIETGLAGMPTCFTGTWGSGRPVIGLLGEFDALDKLSQAGGVTERQPLKEGAPGHGCGHCTLGVGAAAAAMALKAWLEKNGEEGTVVFFGCPAEEGAGAKQFMAREGMFDDVDFVYTWHPASVNAVKNSSSTAIMGANFTFRGKTAHAGACPWAGRSALDAAELMSVGCNYLREHTEDGERIHYAYADAGGSAPNVVPDYARVKYEVRSRSLKALKPLFDRVVRVAEGAALMTDTKMTCEITMAFSDSVNNPALAGVASACLKEIGAPRWDDADYELAAKYLASYDEETLAGIKDELSERFGADALDDILKRPLHSDVLEYDEKHVKYEGGSTDVGDVTYAAPTCEIVVASYCMGNIAHTWQTAGQSGSVLAHKALMTAAAALALSCIRTMHDKAVMDEARSWLQRRNGGAYSCPLPEDVKPPVGRY